LGVTVEKIRRKKALGAKLVFWKVPGVILNFTEFLEARNVICGNMRGFCVNLKDLGLIFKYFSRTRSLNAKFAYKVGMRVNY
jgi:hypothetical protein